MKELLQFSENMVKQRKKNNHNKVKKDDTKQVNEILLCGAKMGLQRLNNIIKAKQRK